MISLVKTTILAAVLAAALAPAAATPLDDLIAPAEGQVACFSRVYDEDHLRRVPGQRTVSTLLWLRYEKAVSHDGLRLSVGLRMARRGEAQPWFASGECFWGDEAKVNRDVQGLPLIPQFKTSAGAGCQMSARPDVFDTLSAEEGGYMLLDPGPDPDRLMLYLQDGLMMVRAKDRATPRAVDFGRDDRAFRLQRVDAKACEPVRRVMTR